MNNVFTLFKHFQERTGIEFFRHETDIEKVNVNLKKKIIHLHRKDHIVHLKYYPFTTPPEVRVVFSHNGDDSDTLKYWDELWSAALTYLEDKGSLRHVARCLEKFQAEFGFKNTESEQLYERSTGVYKKQKTVIVYWEDKKSCHQTVRYVREDGSSPAHVRTLIAKTCFNSEDWINLELAALKVMREGNAASMSGLEKGLKKVNI